MDENFLRIVMKYLFSSFIASLSLSYSHVSRDNEEQSRDGPGTTSREEQGTHRIGLECGGMCGGSAKSSSTKISNGKIRSTKGRDGRAIGAKWSVSG